MMNLPYILRNKWLFRIAIALLLLVPILLSPVYYAQTQGVCLKEGRVLSEEEMRKIVLLNVVNFYIQDTYYRALRWDNDNTWIGLNSPAQETDLLKLVEAAYHSDKSFEENFGLKVILKGQNAWEYEPLTAEELIEPFIFMIYDKFPRGDVVSFISTDIEKVHFNKLDENVQVTARRKATLYKKLLGYGNHYYYIYNEGFHRLCCDNSKDDVDTLPNDKLKAYEEAKKDIIASRKHRTPIRIMVSNCGDIAVYNKVGINFAIADD
jgi:hypothetical protein